MIGEHPPTDSADTSRDAEPPSLSERIDRACDTFEAAWNEHRHPRIEAWFEGFDGPDRAALLAKLLTRERELRVRIGEQPARDEYAHRFPNDAAVIDAVFAAPAPAPLPFVQLPGVQVRCPHCREPVTIREDDSLNSITCVSCGSTFSLVDESTVRGQPDWIDRLGRFEIIEKVGEGAFKTVWKARDTVMDRLVAVAVPWRRASGGRPLRHLFPRRGAVQAAEGWAPLPRKQDDDHPPSANRGRSQPTQIQRPRGRSARLPLTNGDGRRELSFHCVARLISRW